MQPGDMQPGDRETGNPQPMGRKQAQNKRIVINGLGAALVFVTAMFIHIQVPIAGIGGMIHMGDVPLFVFALLYGKKSGALAGALGLTLFDLLSGWTLWAPFTLIIAGMVGWVVGSASERNAKGKVSIYAASIFAALLVTVCGYYVTEGLLYGNWLTPIGSVPVNALQVAIAAVLAYPLAERLKRFV